MNRKRVLAISGSTRKESSNGALINAIGNLFSENIELDQSVDIALLPHFNPDLDKEHPPNSVTTFRQSIIHADGVLICTPEYAMGVPGVLKNAIDWTVSSMEFAHKPVALITASSMGEKAHRSLIDTLLIIEANLPPDSQLLISFIKTKMKDNTVTDEKTLIMVKKLMGSFLECMDTSRVNSI